MKHIKRSILMVFLSLVYSLSYASDDVTGVIARHPSPSPSGMSVVFEADFLGQPNLWVVDLDGKNLHQLTTTNPGIDEEPSWSPIGNSIAFASTQGGATNIWLINPDGSNLQQLTSNALNNRQPSWSPDGKKIVFVSDRGGTNDLWIMSSDGTEQTRLTSLPGEEDHPSFSPDGTKIVFSETINDSANLMIINVDGTNSHQLTSSGHNDWNPFWGTQRILFASNRSGTEHWTIWSIKPDGSELQAVGNTIALDPVQLPNGNIIFADELSRFPKEDVHCAITVLDVDSGIKHAITSTGCINPPSISSIEARPNLLWPPNHKMTTVKINVSVSDECDPNPTCVVREVNSNEAENGLGDGDTAPDWEIKNGLIVDLRAERSGKGSGRIYTVNAECTNKNNLTSKKTVTVLVPKNQGK